MSITPENKIKILEYKLVYEQEKKVSEEFEQGNIDLNYRLSFFKEKVRKNLDSKNANQGQMFNSVFGKDTEKKNNIVIPEDDNSIFESSKKNSNIDKWAKKVYIKIVKATHPDITMHLKSKVLREKFDKIYQVSKNAYENDIMADLIMSAYDLEIDVPDKVIKEHIELEFFKKQASINNNKRMLGWKWYHVPEVNKDAELKKILVFLGFDFTDTKIKDVIKSRRPQRKVGTRPEKLNVKRKRLK